MIDTGIYSPRVTQATVLRHYVIEVTFTDGTRRRIDLEPRLRNRGPIFQPLHDPDYFAKMRVGVGTIEWPNGADIAPETLYEIGELLEPVVPAKKVTS